MSTFRVRLIVSVALLLSLSVVVGCRQRDFGLSGDVAIESKVMPGMKGKLYLRGDKLRIDWDSMSDVFDLKSRKGWRIFRESKAYMELGSKDLSTFSPERENGSVCPKATVPAACHFGGDEVLLGRPSKKWDLYQPDKGFHSYFWTDNATGITLRMEIENAAKYEVKSVAETSVPDSKFELPAGYQKLERPFRP